MKKQSHPLHATVLMIVMLVFSFAVITVFVKMGTASDYSPLHDHVQYVLDKHNDSCKYEVGKCPESLCSHSAIQ